jgi:aminoglycoside phosphotransferase (APT) family kinase protein
VGVLERDPEATATTLARWLQQVAGVERPAVADVSIPGSTGWSNETVLFDAAWGDGDERRTRGLVARIAPSGHQVLAGRPTPWRTTSCSPGCASR